MNIRVKDLLGAGLLYLLVVVPVIFVHGSACECEF